MAGPITLVVFISIRALAAQPREQADLIADLGSTEAAAILGQMDPEVATEVRAMADYDDDHFSRYVYVLSPLGRLVGVASSRRTPSQQHRSWTSAVDCQA